MRHPLILLAFVLIVVIVPLLALWAVLTGIDEVLENVHLPAPEPAVRRVIPCKCAPGGCECCEGCCGGACCRQDRD